MDMIEWIGWSLLGACIGVVAITLYWFQRFIAAEEKEWKDWGD